LSARIRTSLLAAALLLTAPAAQAACPTDGKPVADTVQAFFAALRKDDLAAVQQVTTPDFYAYDVGKHFTSAAELAGAIAQAHKAGVTLDWNLAAIDTHLSCDMAWAAWENHGHVGPADALKPMNWLESAVLVRDHGRWRIRFLHSTRVPPAP
jgi:ketosteroid isomerase-like protein